MLVPMDDPKAPELSEAGTLSIHEVGVEDSAEEMLPVPTDEEIEKTLARIAAHSGSQEVNRNLLFFRWASEAGLRNSEIRPLRVRDLPSRTQVAEWRSRGLTPTMKVQGKGSKRRTIEPPLTLLEDVYSYVADLEEAADPRWLANKKVLFTNKRGRVLSRQYVSHLFAKFFLLGSLDLHLHRARAYYVYKIIEAKVQELASKGRLDELHVATVLRFAADRVGHEDPKTLRYYVRLALVRLYGGPAASLPEQVPLID
jgi:integrase